MRALFLLLSLLSPSLLSATDLFDAGRPFHIASNTVMLVGEWGTFQHRLQNASGDGIETVEINYYLSLDNVPSKSEDYLIASERTAALQNPDDGYVGVDFRVPNNIPEGSYNLVWEFAIDGDENPTDNVGIYRYPFTIRTTPDFDLIASSSGANLTGLTLSAGSAFAATASVLNNGPNRSPGYQVNWFLSSDNIIGTPDDILLEETFEGPIAEPVNFQPQSASIFAGLIIPPDTPPGDYSVGFVVVATNDRLPGNNDYRFSQQMTVVDPDPGYVDLRFVSNSLGIGSTSPSINGTLQVRGRVRNSGDSPSSAFTVKYYARPVGIAGSGNDILLGSVQFPSLGPASLAAGAFPSQTVDNSLSMAGLSTTQSYYLTCLIEGGNDLFEGNNRALLLSAFRPVARPDLELTSAQVLRQDGALLGSFVAFPDYPFRFRGVVRNNTIEETRFGLRITFTRQDQSNEPVSPFLYDEGGLPVRPFAATHELTDVDGEALILASNESASFDFNIEASAVGALASEITWWQNNFNTPNFDVLIEAVPLTATGFSRTDATPTNNRKVQNVSASRIRDVYCSVGILRSTSAPFFPDWDLDYASNGYPILSVTVQTGNYWFTPTQGTPSFALQLYANGVPFGNRTSYNSGAVQQVSISRQLPTSFPQEPTEFSVGLVFEPGSPEDVNPTDNVQFAPYGFLGIGGSTDGRPDLSDAGTQFWQIPSAVNPGTANSLLTFGITNIGLETAGTSVTRVYLSNDNVLDRTADILVGETVVPAIDPNRDATVQVALSVPADIPPGRYFLVWELNAARDFAEWDYRNNIVFAPGRVVVGAESNLTRTTTPFSFSSTVVNQGDTLQLLGSRANTGNEAVGAHTNALILSTDPKFESDQIVFEEGDFLLGEEDTPANFTSDWTGEFTLPSDIEPGLYYARFVFDYLNVIEESNERDNSYGIPALTILPPEVVFEPEILTFIRLDDAVFVRFTSRSDRNYHLRINEDLEGLWSQATFQPIPGEAGVTEFEASDLSERFDTERLFFYIEELPPN